MKPTQNHVQCQAPLGICPSHKYSHGLEMCHEHDVKYIFQFSLSYTGSI